MGDDVGWSLKKITRIRDHSSEEKIENLKLLKNEKENIMDHRHCNSNCYVDQP